MNVIHALNAIALQQRKEEQWRERNQYLEQSWRDTVVVIIADVLIIVSYFQMHSGKNELNKIQIDRNQ